MNRKTGLNSGANFQKNVDKRDMAAVSKLCYLQIYLTPKVRVKEATRRLKLSLKTDLSWEEN